MKFNRIILQSDKPPELADFYSGIMPANLNGDRLIIKPEYGELIFEKGDNACYHFAFNISYDKFEKAKSYLRAKNIELLQYEGKDEIDFPNWDARAIYFFDAGGNIVEFIARKNVPGSSMGEFTSEDILGISELGIATDNVKLTYDKLKELTGESFFKIPGSEEFTAMGNDTGLFIIVKKGRVWFPTDNLTAEAALFEMELEAGGKEFKVTSDFLIY